MPTVVEQALAGLVMAYGAPFDQDCAGGAAQHAEQRQQKVALALPVEAAEADDFALGHREADVAQPVGPAELPAFQRRRLRHPAVRFGLGGKTFLYSRPIIISTTSLSVRVPAL